MLTEYDQRVVESIAAMDTIISSNISYIKLTLTSILLTAAIQSQPGKKGVLTMSFTLTSSAFLHEERIPSQYTCEGEDISPGLEWSDVPEGTKSFTLSCLDPDAPPGTWVHWVLYDLPAGASSLDESLPKLEKLENGALQGACWGVDSFSRVGYYGPCPPPGHGDHRYYFRLYALDTESLLLPPNATWFQVEKAHSGHILGTTEYMGTYSR